MFAGRSKADIASNLGLERVKAAAHEFEVKRTSQPRQRVDSYIKAYIFASPYEHNVRQCLEFFTMNGKIDAYLDCVSPYSYYAIVYLLKNKSSLASYGVEVEFHPIFLGGVNVGSGNKPPWTVPAKAAYSKFDSKRAQNYFGLPNVKTPSFFPILSLLPQRCMVYIKETFPVPKFEHVFRELWIAMWEQQMDLSKPDVMAEVLARHFSAEEVEQVMRAADDPVYKQKLLDNTQKVLGLGAFGAPWMWVRNAKGDAEPFFGSDRFHHMWEYLGLPWNDISIRERSKI